MASASGYNHHRFARAVLKKSRKWEASLTVQLYQAHWRFENSPMTFQYAGPMQPFLLALRAQVIPASLVPFLYDIRPPVSFVDGCLVVEIHDFRKTPEARSRVVMRPAAEALAQTIDVMLERKGDGGNEQMALELESRIIAATSPPLYLGTSILATRNAVLAIALTSPAGPNLSADGSFRSHSQFESEETSEVERMRKLLRAGERSGPFQPNWSILRLKERMENLERQREVERIRRLNNPSLNGQGGGSEAALGIVNGIGNRAGNGEGQGEKKKSKKKRANPPDGGEGEGEKKEKPATKKKKTEKKDGAGAAGSATGGGVGAGTSVREAGPSGSVEPAQPAPKKKKAEKKAGAPPGVAETNGEVGQKQPAKKKKKSAAAVAEHKDGALPLGVGFSGFEQGFPL